jgi:hypothetical protein
MFAGADRLSLPRPIIEPQGDASDPVSWTTRAAGSFVPPRAPSCPAGLQLPLTRGPDMMSASLGYREMPMNTALANIHIARRVGWPFAVLLLGLAVAGCRKDEPASEPPSATAPAPPTFDFPEDRRSDDPAVNEFINHVLAVCTSEDYDMFRLLWTAKQEPPSRQQFEKGWHAHRMIRIRELRKMKTAEGDIVWGALAQMEFDPELVPRPSREVVLLLVKENDQWRLAQAPPAVRKALKPQTAPDDAGAATNGLPAPATQPTNPPSGGQP